MVLSRVLAKSLARLVLIVTLGSVGARVSSAQIVTGSDGSDGAFVFVPDTPGSSAMTIDLALAATGLDGQGQPITWLTPSPVAGRGVYDPFAWAVVFKYASVVVPANKTLRFSNHPSGAPVVWLVQNNATIAGTVDLSGRPVSSGWGVPGPGGFRGHLANVYYAPNAGFGPGGALNGGAGNFGVAGTIPPNGPEYGSPALFPLIGGSGSAMPCSLGGCYNAAGGGGAILIAASNRIDVSGSIFAMGGGSGGGIRLVANVIAKSGSVQATGSLAGRIRFEAPSFEGPILQNVNPTPSLASAPGMLLPDGSTPQVRVVSVSANGQTATVPADPLSRFDPPQADVVLNGGATATVTLEALNVLPGRTGIVRVTNPYGIASQFVTTSFSGSLGLSTATATIPLPIGIYAIQARVEL